MQLSISERTRQYILGHGHVIYLIVAWLLTAVEIDYVIGMTDYMSFLSPLALVQSLVWGAVMLLPLIILPRRLRWIQLVVFCLLAVFNAANCFYYRNFENFIPLRALGMWQGVNEFTLNAVRSTAVWTDLLIPVVLVLQLWLFRRFMHKSGRGLGLKQSVFVAVVVCGSVVMLQSYRYWRFWATPAAYSKDFKSVDSFTALTGTATDFDRKGYFEMYILQAVDIITPTPDLSEDERDEIGEIVENGRDRAADMLTDSITNANHGKNLIFIVVESLNSSALGHKLHGKSLTPVLDSLKSSPDVLCFDNMRSQALLGESSDGQFIYNSGLYPLIGQITMSVEHDGPFPSICRELAGYTTCEYIGEDKDVWFHGESSKAYGYGSLHEKLASDAGDRSDDAILDASLSGIKKMPGPFFAFITTASMHMPFDSYDDSIPSDWPMSESAYGYLLKTGIFDNALGRFIEGLKQAGIYDDSVIVLASDHQVPYGSVRDAAIEDGRIMLMILNSGLPGGMDSRVIGQIDVYPTVLDVMGVKAPRWPGMGQSLIRNVPGFAVLNGTEVVGDTADTAAIERQKRCWQLSDRMIKTNTFPSLP